MTRRWPLCLLAALLVSCSSPEAALRDVDAALAAGDAAAAEQTLRAALEDHPRSLPLLLKAAGFYLRPDPPEDYKPRLALHYAIRAAQVTHAEDPRAVEAVRRAQLAAGGIGAGNDQAAALLRRVQEGLGQRPSPPQGFRPFDPDLLGGSGEEVREQLRRWTARDAAGEPCDEGLAQVPQGSWDIPEPTRVPSFCIQERPDRRPPLRLGGADLVRHCHDQGLRVCHPQERLVACGPMAAVLPRHPSCADPSFARCCADLAGGAAIP